MNIFITSLPTATTELTKISLKLNIERFITNKQGSIQVPQIRVFFLF